MKNAGVILLVAIIGFVAGLFFQKSRETERPASIQRDTSWVHDTIPAKPVVIRGRTVTVADTSLERVLDSILAVVANKDSMLRAMAQPFRIREPFSITSEMDTLDAIASAIARPFRRTLSLSIEEPVFRIRRPFIREVITLPPPPPWMGYAQNGLGLAGGYFAGRDNGGGALTCIGAMILIEVIK